MKHLHILGIGGTFMSALALFARDLGYKVTGSDENCYPPVSTLLEDKGISWAEGYDDCTEALKADVIVVGNAIKRGLPVLEAIMDADKCYTSGPQWLAEHVLSRYKVIAVSGTHGKTTTTSMVAWILQQAGKNPGFLIGGIASNFKTSACLGAGEWFVIEADEYDTAFFDKRPKMMHYRPKVAILNNLEFDHADIYEHLGAIQQQFHYYLKTIPGTGIVIKPKEDKALNEVLAKGYFSRLSEISLSNNSQWSARLHNESGSAFDVLMHGEVVAQVEWPLIGLFNVENALAAIAACYEAGVSPNEAASALASFIPVKRRLEVRGSKHGVTVYDDFAHHPTAIRRTVDALKKSKRHERILVVMEFASYTMRTGVHKEVMPEALSQVDGAYILESKDFDVQQTLKACTFAHKACPSTDAIVHEIVKDVRRGDAILVMSNRGFDGIHLKLVDAVDKKFS